MVAPPSNPAEYVLLNAIFIESGSWHQNCWLHRYPPPQMRRNGKHRDTPGNRRDMVPKQISLGSIRGSQWGRSCGHLGWSGGSGTDIGPISNQCPMSAILQFLSPMSHFDTQSKKRPPMMTGGRWYPMPLFLPLSPIGAAGSCPPSPHAPGPIDDTISNKK